MADYIYCSRFDQTGKTIGISIMDLISAVNNINGLELKKNYSESYDTIVMYSQQHREVIPLFWIDEEGIGYTKQAPFTSTKEAIDKGIELVDALNGIIYSEHDQQIICLPKYGLIYEKLAPLEELVLTISDLIKHSIDPEHIFL